MRQIVDRLALISSHEALILLRSSESSACFLHVLRCADTRGEGAVLQRIDHMFSEILTKTLNIDFDEPHLRQAGLPVRMGGLGIRSLRDLATPVRPVFAPRGRGPGEKAAS